MITFNGRSADGQSFSLTINGREQTYTSDKAGKRQAILDGLQAVETLAVGEDVYLPGSQALQVVATVLYPQGITSDEAYRIVCDVTGKACAHIGFGPEEELGPPVVSFAQRGAYRKRFPELDTQLILDELAQANVSFYRPRRELGGQSLWSQAAWAVYNRAWRELNEGQRGQIEAQVTAAAGAAGWDWDEEAEVYFRPLPANLADLEKQLAAYLDGAGGRPLPARTLQVQVQQGAYGRTFYDEELPSETARVVARLLAVHGYEVEPAAGEYRPRKVVIDEEAAGRISAELARLRPQPTDLGPALLLDEVLEVVRAAGGEELAISPWQAEQLIEGGFLGRALGRLGYRARLSRCQAYHFRPPRADGQSRQVILKAVRVENDPGRSICLARGLPVHTPALAIDDEADTLVYLEMVGPKQSVKANWAALAGGGKVHWLGRRRVQLSGMKQHIRLQSALPCGWTDCILLHRQASLKEMNPEQPFYLLDDGNRPMPPLFYAMLNKALALPLLADWAGYLWEIGRERELIQLLDDGAGQGYAAWRVLPVAEGWQEVVQAGLRKGVIGF